LASLFVLELIKSQWFRIAGNPVKAA